MERREFIIKSGQVMTVAMFLNFIGTKNLLAEPNHNNISSKRPIADNFAKPIHKAIALGINAASPQNIQSWKFKIVSDTEMYLYIDENKLLSASDPLARQIHIAAGCFIETLSIGISKYGFKPEINYFPEGYNSSVDFGVKPVAQISLTKQDKGEHLLSSYIHTRQTNRKRYRGNHISMIEYLDLKRLIGKTNSKFVFANTPEEMKPYFNYFTKAARVEFETNSVLIESRKMFRFSNDEVEKARDGLSVFQLGIGGLHKWFFENSLKDGDKDIWQSQKIIDDFINIIEKQIESSKAIIMIKTNSNKYMDWIKVGRDYTKLNLACAYKEIQVQPINHITNDYEEMQFVQKNFNELAKTRPNEKIQMVLRIGRARNDFYSYRKEVSKLVEM